MDIIVKGKDARVFIGKHIDSDVTIGVEGDGAKVLVADTTTTTANQALADPEPAKTDREVIHALMNRLVERTSDLYEVDIDIFDDVRVYELDNDRTGSVQFLFNDQGEIINLIVKEGA